MFSLPHPAGYLKPSLERKTHKTQRPTSGRLSSGWKKLRLFRVAALICMNQIEGALVVNSAKWELSDVAVDCVALTAVSRRNGTLEGTSGAKCRCTQPSSEPTYNSGPTSA